MTLLRWLPRIAFLDVTYMVRRPIKYVAQAHDDGCGPACVAMICGITFEEVADDVWHHRRDHTGLKQMMDWLQRFGAVHGGRFVETEDSFTVFDLPSDAVLLVDMENAKRVADGHWVVWDVDAQRLQDPHDQTRDLAEVEVDSFLLVTRRP